VPDPLLDALRSEVERVYSRLRDEASYSDLFATCQAQGMECQGQVHGPRLLHARVQGACVHGPVLYIARLYRWYPCL
jgi:hypothetical protein